MLPSAHKVYVVVIIVLVVIIIVAVSWQRDYKFQEVALNSQQEVLDNLKKRATLRLNTTSQTGLLGVVGLILVTDNTGNEHTTPLFDGQSAIPTYRPSPELILVEPIGKTLYEGKISKGLTTGGDYASFSAGLDAKQTAEMLIVDDVYFTYRDRTKIPFSDLRKFKRLPGKKYFFVEGATVTSTTYKTYDEVSSNGTLEASTFKANGKLYTSKSGFAYQVNLAVDVFDLQSLQSIEAGTDPRHSQILGLYRMHVSGTLNPEDAKKLVGLLQQESSPEIKAIQRGVLSIPEYK